MKKKVTDMKEFRTDFFSLVSWGLLADNEVIFCGVLCDTLLYFLLMCSGTF